MAVVAWRQRIDQSYSYEQWYLRNFFQGALKMCRKSLHSKANRKILEVSML